MRRLVQLALAGLFCVGMAAGAVIWLLGLGAADLAGAGADHAAIRRKPPAPAGAGRSNERCRRRWAGRREDIRHGPREIRRRWLRDGRSIHGTDQRPGVASRSCARRSAGRGPRALAGLQSEYARLKLDSSPVASTMLKKVQLEQSIGFVHMYDGRFPEASAWFQKALESSRPVWCPRRSKPDQGGAGYRRHAARRDRELPRVRGPVELYLSDRQPGPASESRPARARRSSGSPSFWRHSPRDLRVIWLLNIAYMTLGEHPEKVPPQYLIPTGVVSLDGRGRAVRECCASRRAGRARPESGGRQHFRRFQRRQPARPLHHVARCRTRRDPLDQSRRRHVRGPVDRRRI